MFAFTTKDSLWNTLALLVKFIWAKVPKYSRYTVFIKNSVERKEGILYWYFSSTQDQRVNWLKEMSIFRLFHNCPKTKKQNIWYGSGSLEQVHGSHQGNKFLNLNSLDSMSPGTKLKSPMIITLDESNTNLTTESSSSEAGMALCSRDRYGNYSPNCSQLEPNFNHQYSHPDILYMAGNEDWNISGHTWWSKYGLSKGILFN